MQWVAREHAELECLLGDFGDRINVKGRADLASAVGTKGRSYLKGERDQENGEWRGDLGVPRGGGGETASEPNFKRCV